MGEETVTVATGASATVMEAAPLWPSLVAVIVVLPAPTDVTRPFVSTVAAVVLLETHVTVRPVSTLPFASVVVAVSWRLGVMPSTKLAVAGVTVTFAIGTGSTVITGVEAELTDSEVAVIVAVPTATAVSVAVEPVALTVSAA